MQAIYFAASIALIWLHLAAVTALIGPRFGSWALGRAAGVLLGVLLLFFIEHFYGLGSLSGLWPLTSALAAAALYRQRKTLPNSGFWQAELVLGLAFAYGLLWRGAFPSIYPTSERVTDLYFIVNYLQGEQLPPLDHWFPPHRFGHYYSLQHYAAALIGRLFSLSPGLTYNLSFCLLMGLGLSLVWDLASQHLKHWAPRLLLVAAVAVGGTGAAVFTQIGKDKSVATDASARTNLSSEIMWGGARFIGNFDQRLDTPIGKSLFPLQNQSNFKPRDLPLENFGYQFYVGDYHPPLGGFFLLLLALAALSRLSTTMLVRGDVAERERMALLGLLALTIPAQIATNAWVFPLQALLIGAWAGWQFFAARLTHKNMLVLLGGGVLGVLLLYPFLQTFGAQAQPTPIRLVKAGDHTPLPQFLALTWPLLILMVLGLFQRYASGLPRFMALLFAGLLLMSELVFVDDRSGDHFERTNTVMKWWGYIWTGGLVALGGLLLAAPARWVRWTTIAALAGTLIYLINIELYWRWTGKHDAGVLSADRVYTRDGTSRDVLRYLTEAPRGIVLANQRKDAYDDGAIYAAFSAKPMLLGWPSHLDTWMGYRAEVWNLVAETRAFYAGTLEQPGAWLKRHDVRYIVWTGADAQDAATFAKWRTELAADYEWHNFAPANTTPVGVWVRRQTQ